MRSDRTLDEVLFPVPMLCRCSVVITPVPWLSPQPYPTLPPNLAAIPILSRCIEIVRSDRTLDEVLFPVPMLCRWLTSSSKHKSSPNPIPNPNPNQVAHLELQVQV